jgi:hypothetical protein
LRRKLVDSVGSGASHTAVGLDGNHANIAMLQTPDGNGRLELFEYNHPDAIETERRGTEEESTRRGYADRPAVCPTPANGIVW